MIRSINLVLSCERVVLICGCCKAHLRPREGITWPLIGQHLKLHAAEVDSSMHSKKATVLQHALPVCICGHKLMWIHMLMRRSHSMKNKFGRRWKRCQVHIAIYGQALKNFGQTQIMPQMLFASFSGLLKHCCVKSAGILFCLVCHAFVKTNLIIKTNVVNGSCTAGTPGCKQPLWWWDQPDLPA